MRSSLQLLSFELIGKWENEGIKGLQPAEKGILLLFC